MHGNIDVLMELVKFDMQQIQVYREAILKLAIMCIAASCSMFAFLTGTDHRITAKNRLFIALTVNIGLLLMLGIVAIVYCAGLDGSRACLDKREDAVKAWIASTNTYVIRTSDIYPNPEAENYPPHMSSNLEKMPVYIACFGIVVLGTLECLLFAQKTRRHHKAAAAAAKPGASLVDR